MGQTDNRKGGEITRLKDVHYTRTFAGNNDHPREYIGQYENEKVGITISSTEDHEGAQVLFEKALETVHELQEQAVLFRKNRREIEHLKEELEGIKDEIEDAKNVIELNARALEIEEKLKELGAGR